MGGLIGSHAAFLAVAIATHALVGYTLGSVLADSPLAGLVGGVLADADLVTPAAWGFPLAHRGITHTAFAAGFATVVVLALANRRAAIAFGAGYASQLLLDATTPMGVPLAYPLRTDYVGVTIGGHSEPATAVLWVCCLSILWYDRRESTE